MFERLPNLDRSRLVFGVGAVGGKGLGIQEVHREPMGKASPPLDGSEVRAPVEIEESVHPPDQGGQRQTRGLDRIGGGVGPGPEKQDMSNHGGTKYCWNGREARSLQKGSVSGLLSRLGMSGPRYLWGMRGSQPYGPLVLPLARWTGTSGEVHIVAKASDCPALLETDVVGDVFVEGRADINPAQIVVKLLVRCQTREICGRSLEEFDHPLEFPVQILLHRSSSVQGVVWEEDGDEAFEATISEDLHELEIEEIVRQSVVLERPISPVKPGTPLPEGVVEEGAEDSVDPRWEALRKIRGELN